METVDKSAPPAELVDRLASLFAEKRELPARSTSMPTYDGDEQHGMVWRFFAPLYPPQRPGAGLPQCVAVWMGRIPLERLVLMVRELETARYKGERGTKGDQGWGELPLATRKRLVQYECNGMMRQEDERGRRNAQARRSPSDHAPARPGGCSANVRAVDANLARSG